MNNIPTNGANHPHNSDVSSTAAATPQSRNAPVAQPVDLSSNIPAMNSATERTTSLLTSTEAGGTAAVPAQRAEHPGLGPEGVKYASPLAQIRPAWQAFSSKVVDGVLELDCKLGAEETHDLAEWLKSSPPEVLTLFLKTNFSHRSVGLVQLTEALKVNTTLTSLHMHHNNLGDPGAAMLAEALKVNATLTTLDLYDNNIRDAGAVALSEMLKVNRSLGSIYLGLNLIDDAGAAALARALKVNHALNTLSVRFNRIRATGATALAEALETNQGLTALYVDRNPICFDGATKLAEVLKVNVTLTTLDVSNCDLGAAELAGLGQALKVNTTLTTLTIKSHKMNMKSGNLDFTDDATPEITSLLQRNQQLSQRVALAGVALDLASGQQYPAEVMALIAEQLPLVPVGQRVAALLTLQQLSTSVETPLTAD